LIFSNNRCHCSFQLLDCLQHIDNIKLPFNFIISFSKNFLAPSFIFYIVIKYIGIS
jgi:hypothetical protein